MIILENGHAFGTTLQLKMKIKTNNSILLSKVGCLMFSYDELVNRQKKKKGRKKEGRKKEKKTMETRHFDKITRNPTLLLVRIHYYNFTFDHEKSLKILKR